MTCRAGHERPVGGRNRLAVQVHCKPPPSGVVDRAVYEPLQLKRGSNVPRVTEGSLIGAAVLGAVGAGFYPDLASAAEAMIDVQHVIEPVERNVRTYDALFKTYRAAYQALQPIWAERTAGS